MRSVLNIAITEMVHREAFDPNNRTNFDNTCPSHDGKYVPAREGFMWSEQLQGVILGAFFWGYVSKPKYFHFDHFQGISIPRLSLMYPAVSSLSATAANIR